MASPHTLGVGGTSWACPAFGAGLKDLARAGQPPLVLFDSARFLAARGLTRERLFSSPVNKRQLVALKDAYDSGRRALRSAKVAANLDPAAAANLLLLWLGALPEPLFPAEHVPELLTAAADLLDASPTASLSASLSSSPTSSSCHPLYHHHHTTNTNQSSPSPPSSSGTSPHAARSPARSRALATVRALLKRTEPFIVEALYPLFELLHHYWINQSDREGCLAELASTFAVPVFGMPPPPVASPACNEAAAAIDPHHAATLEAATALLIAEYRPLFTQPYNLQRYAADLARQAAEQEAKAARAADQAAMALRMGLSVSGSGLNGDIDAATPGSTSGPTPVPHQHQHQHHYHTHVTPRPITTTTTDGLSPSSLGGSPLLTPRRLGMLSVMAPPPGDSLFGTSPDEGLGSPLFGGLGLGDAPILDGGDGSADVEAMVEGLVESTVADAFYAFSTTPKQHQVQGDAAAVIDAHAETSHDTSDSDMGDMEYHHGRHHDNNNNHALVAV